MNRKKPSKRKKQPVKRTGCKQAGTSGGRGAKGVPSRGFMRCVGAAVSGRSLQPLSLIHISKRVDIQDINEQYLNEFLEALQAAINQLSAEGERISFLPSKGRELSKYMATTLDADWLSLIHI